MAETWSNHITPFFDVVNWRRELWLVSVAFNWTSIFVQFDTSSDLQRQVIYIELAFHQGILLKNSDKLTWWKPLPTFSAHLNLWEKRTHQFFQRIEQKGSLCMPSLVQYSEERGNAKNQETKSKILEFREGTSLIRWKGPANFKA